jgi:hypothetical protein
MTGLIVLKLVNKSWSTKKIPLINLIISGDKPKLMEEKKRIVKIKICEGKILLIRPNM